MKTYYHTTDEVEALRRRGEHALTELDTTTGEAACWCGSRAVPATPDARSLPPCSAPLPAVADLDADVTVARRRLVEADANQADRRRQVLADLRALDEALLPARRALEEAESRRRDAVVWDLSDGRSGYLRRAGSSEWHGTVAWVRGVASSKQGDRAWVVALSSARISAPPDAVRWQDYPAQFVLGEVGSDQSAELHRHCELISRWATAAGYVVVRS